MGTANRRESSRERLRPDVGDHGMSDHGMGDHGVGNHERSGTITNDQEDADRWRR